jgi:hypothetical protein
MKWIQELLGMRLRAGECGVLIVLLRLRLFPLPLIHDTP